MPHTTTEQTRAEILDFWKDTLPPRIVRTYRALLPKRVGEPPAIGASDDELMSFYRELVPKPLVTMLERVAELEFPVVDLRQLSELLGRARKPVDATDRELIACFQGTEFPLRAVRPAFDIVTVRTLSKMFASCHREYRACMRKTDLNGQPRQPTTQEAAKCETELQGCGDDVSMQVFVAHTGHLWRQPVPPHWDPWWPGPRPDPEPPYVR